MTVEQIWNEYNNLDINIEYICNKIYIEIINQIKEAFFNCETKTRVIFHISKYIQNEVLQYLKSSSYNIVELNNKIKDEIIKKLEKDEYVYYIKEWKDIDDVNEIVIYLFELSEEQNKKLENFNKKIKKMKNRYEKPDNLLFIYILFFIPSVVFYLLEPFSVIITGIFTLSIFLIGLFCGYKFTYYKSSKIEKYKKEKFEYIIKSGIHLCTKNNFVKKA